MVVFQKSCYGYAENRFNNTRFQLVFKTTCCNADIEQKIDEYKNSYPHGSMLFGK